MIIKQLREYLDTHNVRYTTTSHSPAFTAREVAKTAHIPSREMAKVVVLRKDDQLLMAVLPASYRINSQRMMDVLHAKKMRLAVESAFKHLFPGCEPGAMPPFGHLFGMETIVAKGLAQEEYISFSAGTHSDVVTMRWEDYKKLEQPTILSFTSRTHPSWA